MLEKIRSLANNLATKHEENTKTMRELHMFAIKDMKAGEYIGPPFFQPTPVHAIRAFRTEINRENEQNMLYLYPEEYELHYLGTFDQVNGGIAPVIEKLMGGAAVKNK